MIRAVLALCLTAALSGCASLYWAGASEYEVSPIISDGKIIGCCTLTVHSGKQYATINARFVKDGDNYDISLDETQIQAFKGQAIAAGAASDAIGAAVTAGVTAATQLGK